MSSPPVFTGSSIQLPSLTTTERNALTAAAGMIIYNSTTATAQKYEGGSWVDLSSGTSSFADNAFFITDNSDATKKIAFEASGITTATTRTLTAPNKSGTLLVGDTTAIFPKRATMWHDEALVTTGNALARTNNSSQNYAHYVFQSTAANGDTFTNGCWLAAGTYTMSMMGVTATSAGIIDWYIDTVIIAALTGQDWYVASPAFNVIKTGSVTVVGDGYHVIKGVVNSKNASSSGYNINLTKYWFTPSSD